jgi:hypothetical protein
MCPESVVQVVRRHPDTIYYNGWNKGLCHALTRDQQHHIGAEDNPAPVDQGFDKSSCSSFQLYCILVCHKYIYELFNCVRSTSATGTRPGAFQRI